MIIQYSEGLPLLEIVEEKRALVVSSSEGMESALVTFYDRFLAEDTEYFAVGPRFASGLHALMHLIEKGSASGARYIKGQTTGPVTFAAGIQDINGKSVLHNPELLEAMTSGLAIKALWQVRRLQSGGKPVILFLDEPYLSGYGSAFTPIRRDLITENIRFVIDYLRERSDCLVGIHCCGNTDWPMVLETRPDIVNFDAFEYMDSFLLYPSEIRKFLEEGGAIAWGMVPTSAMTGRESLEDLRQRLESGIRRLIAWGIDPHLIARQSLLTPSCGMGSLTSETARKVLSLLAGLAVEMSGADWPRH